MLSQKFLSLGVFQLQHNRADALPLLTMVVAQSVPLT